MIKLLIPPCRCAVCKALEPLDRAFESKIIRIGRRYKVANKKLLRPKVGVWDDDEGSIVYVRLPYGFE